MTENLIADKSVKEKKLTKKQRAFIEFYLQSWNATQAAQQAGYKNPNNLGPKTLHIPIVDEAVQKRLEENKIKANEVITRLMQIAEANPVEFFDLEDTGGKLAYKGVNWKAVKEKGYLVKGVKYSRNGTLYLEFHDPQIALDRLGRHLGLFSDKIDQSGMNGGSRQFTGIPADLIAPSFSNVYRDIKSHLHTEYLFYGGRGSTKSTFISLCIISLLVLNPQTHALAARQVADTLRDSVYAQLVWAINQLDLADSFSCTTSPLEIKYKPTGQTIYFRGANDPGKIKSIKPKFGYISLLWFEELDQFHGEEAIRKIEQSVIRGGDIAYIFKSWNPPRTANNWANKYAQIPKETQYQHRSDYTTVPTEWLGKTFIEEAEHLKLVNPKAFEHEYMGISNGTGGLVFENLEIRQITDEEIKQFDHIEQGADWGYYPDPFAWGRSHYDAARLTLYIFDEFRANKMSNRAVYDHLLKTGRLFPNELIIADSAEPKSIADFKSYGAYIRGAEKGPDSVSYSMKWLQSLVKIVIDPVRCPHHTKEFMDYELGMDKDGNFISEYPDHDNHFIDEVRYRTNLIWRKRGQ